MCVYIYIYMYRLSSTSRASWIGRALNIRFMYVILGLPISPTKKSNERFGTGESERLDSVRATLA